MAFYSYLRLSMTKMWHHSRRNTIRTFSFGWCLNLLINLDSLESHICWLSFEKSKKETRGQTKNRTISSRVSVTRIYRLFYQRNNKMGQRGWTLSINQSNSRRWVNTETQWQSSNGI